MLRSDRQLGYRLAALAVAAVLACAQLSAVAHHTLVRHAVCFEHGDWVEVEDGAQSAELPTGLNALPAETSPEHGHAHCAVTLGRRDAEQVRPPFVAVSERPAELVPAIPALSSGVPPLAPLRVAPKASPPA